MRLYVILFPLLYLVATVNSAKILAVVFTPSYSHQLAFRPIWKALAKRGHEITLLTTNPETEDPDFDKIRQIDLHGCYKVMEEYGTSEILSSGRKGNKSLIQRVFTYWDALDAAADWQLSHPEVKALIKNNSEHFDLVVTEIMNPIHMAFAERFKVPFIGIASLDAPYRIHESLGNYLHPTLYPDYFLPFAPPLTFAHRILSVIFNWVQYTLMHLRQYPRQTQIARKHFGDEIRDLGTIEKDMSFLFITVNPAFQKIRPLGLNTIVLNGGSHVQKSTKGIPEDLLRYLDNAKEGVIYVSFGTNVKSTFIGDQLKKVLLEVFSKLPYKILWKFEDESIEKQLPKNIRLEKWLPQQAIFGHPNVKLFVTQCGQQSMEEAIMNHLPMVAVTFMGDQHVNGKLVERNGLGFGFHRDEVTSESLEKAILEAINNPKYKETVVDYAKLITDVEVPPDHRAVYWIEYCIRTKGAKHLRSPAIDMPFYQFYYLDVIGFFVGVLVILISIIVMIVKLLCCCCRGTKSLKSKNKNKKD